MPHHRHSVRAENEALDVREFERRLVRGARVAIAALTSMSLSTKQSVKKPRSPSSPVFVTIGTQSYPAVADGDLR